MTTEENTPRHPLADKAAELPANPGVYLMKDGQGSVIYVGKAKVLRNRVRSYFQRLQDATPKTRLMVSKITDIETIVTPSEKDALILENNLIKKYRPRYNVVFRDDKEYPYLRLAAGELYPNLTIVRRPKKDGSAYFGPFASVQALRETLKAINAIFPLRKCSGKRFEKKRPCIYHQLGQCPAPCCCMVEPAQYQKTVTDVKLFLQGRSTEVLGGLRQRMQEASEDLNFELAAQLRDRIAAIETTLEKTTLVNLDLIDRDVFAFWREDSQMAVTIMFVRNGRMMGSRNILIRKLQIEDDEAISSFISQYYSVGEYIPQEVIVPLQFEEIDVLEDFLREQKAGPVACIWPQRGPKMDLLRMATQNAELFFKRNREIEQRDENLLKDLQGRLHLRTYPARICCFDISNIQGTSAVGSMVYFEDGKAGKDGYRRFRIRSVHQPDDYAMMYEVLTRYLTRAKETDSLPDLIMVDGGKGQLSVLDRAFADTGITTVDAAALAKGRLDEKTNQMEDDKVFLPHRKNPVVFPKQSQTLYLLQRIRDEAHRFAITYFKTLKKKKDFTSALETVPGLGKKTAREVLKHFGSLDAARSATLEQLLEVPGMTRPRAEALYNFFKGA
jgi:excinuclease ABC subunit C